MSSQTQEPHDDDVTRRVGDRLDDAPAQAVARPDEQERRLAFDDLVRRKLHTTAGRDLTALAVLALAFAASALRGYSVFAAAILAVAFLVAGRFVPHAHLLAPPEITANGTIIRSHRWAAINVCVLALGLALAAAGLQEQLAVWGLGALISMLALIAISSVLAVWGVLGCVRPYRLSIGPREISLRAIRTQTLAWSQVSRITFAEPSRGRSATAMAIIVGAGEEELVFPTALSEHNLWVLIEWLEFYRDHPGERDELGTSSSIVRLRRIHLELSDESVEPAWFPPPRRGGRAAWPQATPRPRID